MAWVLDKATIIEMLKRGSEIRGEPSGGYTLYYGTYDGWTVRYDTLLNLRRQELLTEEQSKTSTNMIYKWKDLISK